MKLKKNLNRIPRPLKACLCAILVIVLAAAYYIALGCPTNFRQEFRRAEKSQLIGPSQIVDTLKNEYQEFENMIVGETEYGICFFGEYTYNNGKQEKTEYCLSYQEKTGDLTVAVPPTTSTFNWSGHCFARSLPVYLFTDESEAVRAEIDLTVAGEYSYYSDHSAESVKRPLMRTCQAEARRSDTGIFRFWFEADDQAGLAALQYLSNAIGGNAFEIVALLFTPSTIQATVRLYDAQDQLIREETQTLYSVNSG